MLALLISVVRRRNEKAQRILWIELTSDVCEELSVRARFSHYIFSFKMNSEREIGICTFGLEWPKEGRGNLQKLVM